MRVILGSQSPRRKEILGYFSLPFEQVSPGVDENIIPFSGDPIVYVSSLAKLKAEAVALRYPDDVVIGADTIVVFGGQVFEKPKTAEEAFQTLKTLSGNWHRVFTALTLRRGEEVKTNFSQTDVEFHPLTNEQIQIYQDKTHCFDKAGGYHIQQGGGIIVKRIKGCYYNVMGFPIHTLKNLLLHFEIDLWDYL